MRTIKIELVILIATGIICWLGTSTIQAEETKKDTGIKLLGAFESREEIQEEWSEQPTKWYIIPRLKWELSNLHATQGTDSLKVSFLKQKHDFSSFYRYLTGENRDWSKYKSLNFDIYNEKNKGVKLYINIKGISTENPKEKKQYLGYLKLKANAMNHLEIPTSKLTKSGINLYEVFYICFSYTFSTNSPDPDCTLFFDNIRLIAKNTKEAPSELVLLPNKNNENNKIIIRGKVNSISNFQIVTRENPSKAVFFAAQELQRYIQKVTKVKPNIIEGASNGGKSIFIGHNLTLPKKKEFDPLNYKEEKFLITEWNGNIVIMGGESDIEPISSQIGNFGVLYGTYEFIERFLGVRWYAPGELGECYETKGEIEISGLPIEQRAAFFSRTYWPFIFNEATIEESYLWYRRLKGIGIKSLNPNHSMVHLVQYKDSHPEIFALSSSKERILGNWDEKTKKWKGGYPQYCLSHPNTLKLYLKSIDDWYSGTKEGRLWIHAHPTDDFIYVVPDDNFRTNPCHCKACQAKMDPSRGDKGIQSNLVWEFVAKVAKEVSKKYPDKKVVGLAYEGYYLPPRNVILPDNVIVRLCVNPYMIYFGLPEYEKELERMIEEWSKHVSSISVWQYYLPYSDVPYFLPHKIVNYYKKHKNIITSCFTELMDTHLHHRPIKKVLRYKNVRVTSDLAQVHLNLFFTMKALWGGYTDVDQELDCYYKLFFGPASVPMKKFHELLIDRWENVRGVEAQKGAYPTFSGQDVYGKIYPPEVVEKAVKLFDEAMTLAPSGSIYRKRLEWIRDGYFDEFQKIATAFHKENKENWIVTELSEIEAPVIDGKLDDKIWKTVEKHELFKTDGPIPPRFPTSFKLSTANNTLFIAVKGTDPDWENQRLVHTTYDSPVYTDDSIEIFICPDINIPETYYQICINLKDVIFDRRVINMNGDPKWQSGVKSKTVIEEGFWVMEIALPLKSLDIEKIISGTTWRFNLCRNKRSGVGENHELSQWTPTCRNFNKPKDFGKILFTEQSPFFETFSGPEENYSFAFYRAINTPDGIKPDYSEGYRNWHKATNDILLWKVTFPANKKQCKAEFFFNKAVKDINVSNSPWCELRFCNTYKDVGITAVYSYEGIDGKKYTDSFRISSQEGSPKWRVKVFNFAKDGVRAKKAKRIDKKDYASPLKLTYFAIYLSCSCSKKEEVIRHIELDYIRITNHPIKLVRE
ncbi:DUF4838 domain-containing protein [bacterium]|nr:DUF4838 domain-containing protein [bacterium]